MRLNLIPLTALMLLYFCSGHPLIDDDDSNEELNEDSFLEDFPNLKRPPHRSALHRSDKKQMSDLNGDCLYLIFEDLNFMDLLNLVLVNETVSPVAAELVRRKYGHYGIEFGQTQTKEAFFMSDSLDNPIIQVDDFRLISTILKHFGAVLHEIRFLDPKLSPEELKTVYKMVNKYCSESLFYLDLGTIKESTFEQLRLPFENLEGLTFSIKGYKIRNEIRPFNQLFPKLHELSLTLFSNLDYSFIDCELPHLENIPHFGVTDESWYQKEQIEGFLRKNPQIKSIHMNSKFPPDFAKNLSELLPNVESLTLNSFNIGNESVRFENVKHLVLDEKHVKSIGKLSLPQLETLEMFYSSEVSGGLAFFRRHPLLSSLILNWEQKSGHGQLDDFAEVLPNLVEFQVDYPLECTIDSFAKFIKYHRKLREFTIRLTKSSSLPIRDRFKNDFHIIPQKWDTDVHVFTRKH